MLDLVIRGGLVVDGTGAPARRADVGLRDGRIVALGAIDESARRSIDADGRVVAPGFVDAHTHYDAQLLWDPAATPSCFHGVTSVIGGNCGFTLAPLGSDDDIDYIRRMMARVEGMPLAALEAGITWNWRTFAEYLDRLDGHLAVNAGFLVGHSALRRAVLGDASGAPIDDRSLDAMRNLLDAALTAGGLGFSSSHNSVHTDGDALPVPSRSSERDELLALSALVGGHPGTSLEYITSGCLSSLTDDEIALMVDMTVAARRPLNWNVLTLNPSAPDHAEHQLRAGSLAAEQGGRIMALMMPGNGGLRLSFLNYCALFTLPGFRDVMERSVPERMAALSDPDTRRMMEHRARAETVGPMRGLTDWSVLRIGQVFAPENEVYVDRFIGDIAQEQGRDPFDVLAEIVVADELRTHLWPERAPDSAAVWDVRARFLLDERVLVGGSDAGAHLDRMCGARYTTDLLANGVRKFGALTIEQAVRLLTDAPARLFGLRERGRLTEGWWGDIVVFDPDTVAPEPIVEVADLPGGCERLTAAAVGIDHVLVNGTEIVRGGVLTGAEPGTLMRSGRDTV
jgi:N-acyl-D-aspartate/D-glutamate deacylase